ncbi:FHA domain-containing protein [Mycolicibacterium stellerae]|uniref:FHA domain-containing protein n=1 Tax=Mycolicibacterium stellerae TaxID=2358193 RepID=UPI000F0B5A96|nr:FHA domain-containing protein [Mycolicibacterium stellerae]
MPTCVEGHATQAVDYCDVCGSPVTTPVAQPVATPAASKACPACGAPIGGRFCEACGHDSALPEPAAAPQPLEAPAPIEWTATVTADQDYYKRVIARGGPDTVDFPEFFPERRIVLYGNTLIGRTNRKQGVEPGIDLGIQPIDRGVSTQHAVLRIQGSELTVTDLGSTNGTSLNDSDDLLGNGEEITLADGDRIHLGAWTTITVSKSEKGRT